MTNMINLNCHQVYKNEQIVLEMLFWFLSVSWSSANLRRPHSNSSSEHYIVEMILASFVSGKLGNVNLPTSPAIIPWSTRVIFKCFVVRYKIVIQLIEDVQAERWELISERIAALLNLCKEPMFIRYLVEKKNNNKKKVEDRSKYNILFLSLFV